MRTRAAQFILATTALVVGAVQPAVNGLSMLCLAMVAGAGYLEWRLHAAAQQSPAATADREAA